MSKTSHINTASICKALFVALFTFFGCTQMNAQIDNTSGGFKIPAVVDTTKQKQPEQAESQNKEIKPENNPSAIPMEDPEKVKADMDAKLSSLNDMENEKFFMLKKEEFADPNQRHLERLNRKPEPNYSKKDKAILAEMAKDMDLGTFRTGGDKVQIMCRDYQAVDGDKVAILLNDEVIVEQVWLTESYRGFYVSLKKGFNKISFKALNQGSSGPNTADLVVYDDKGKLVSSSGWNLLTGAQADIVVIKE